MIYVPTIVRNDERRMQQETGENGLATKKTGRIISICHRRWPVHIVYAPLSRQEACESSSALLWSSIVQSSNAASARMGQRPGGSFEAEFLVCL